jgi:hypothetical protein
MLAAGVSSARTETRWPAAFRIATVIAALLIGFLYLWCAQATNGPFLWNQELGGYYNLLARGFVGGHLYLSWEPSPQLLALADPYDPAQNEPYRLQDAVFYNRRYYLYHGVAPAVMLFAPWRLLTGHDLPENFVVFLFCFLGYLCSCGLAMQMLSVLRVRPPLALFALLLLTLGICPSLPYLLQRVQMYEVAIAGGYFCLSAGFFFLARGWLALAGLFLGLAAGCRPHLAAPAAFAALLVCWMKRSAPRRVAAFLLPLAACWLAIAGYNYARFGNPLEFGFRFQLGGAAYRGVRFSRECVLPGLYYLLIGPPIFEPVFPFFRLGSRLPFGTIDLPARYFLEPIAGALVIFPLSLIGLAAPLFAAVRGLVCVLLLSSISSIAFIAPLGLATQRFEVDFLPALVLVACVALAVLWARIGGVARALVFALLLYSVAVNLSLGMQGPYDDYVQTHPEAYAKLARWFSPVERFRPIHNPYVLVEASFEFPARMSYGLPLVGAGRFGSRYLLYVEPAGANRLRLVSERSRTSGEVATADVAFVPGQPNRLRLEFTPADRFLSVHWNEELVLRYPLGSLVTAPAQVTVGEDRTETGFPPPPFVGRVVHHSLTVAAR